MIHNEPAFSIPSVYYNNSQLEIEGCKGLTKLEYIATHIANGFASQMKYADEWRNIPKIAVKMAKEILEECDKSE